MKNHGLLNKFDKLLIFTYLKQLYFIENLGIMLIKIETPDITA